MIRIEYDIKADAAYIYFSKFPAAKVARTYPCDPSEVEGMISLDFDENNVLIGVEVIDASKKLSKEMIDSAEKI